VGRQRDDDHAFVPAQRDRHEMSDPAVIGGGDPYVLSARLEFGLWRFSLDGLLAVQERGGERVAERERMVDDQRGAS
jgi:hypothetical protein